MCGIAGFYSLDSKYDENTLRQMTDQISHRGPDASGIVEKNNVYLGHRRLSILDTSDHSNQPFYSRCGNFIMIYNGEVYNFRELRSKYNIDTQTHSDTEVIIELFAQIGSDMVQELNGMFSLAIFDIQGNQLFLCRDRIGIKPLFYFQSDSLFAFSSELKSISKIQNGKQNINHDSISNFLCLGYVPEPDTIFSDVYKFPSGHFGFINLNEGIELKLTEYWNPSKQISKSVLTNEVQAKSELKKLLESSISYRMISDVPLGTFLSGGTDSSTVTAISQHLSDQPIKTFSIGFDESKHNEAHHAKDIAKYLKTDHHELILSEQDGIEQVEKLLDIYDEPFSDSSAIPTLLVSEMARKHVTVALSGDGGDELFMGYGMYNWANRLSNPFINTFRKPIASLLKLGNNRSKRAAQVFDFSSNERLKSHIFSQEQYLFAEKELSSLLRKKAKLTFDESLGLLNRDLSAAEEQALFDLKNYLKDDLLVKVDRASMFHSLEVRVPLLDHRIIEFSLNLHEDLKIKNGSQKHLLKDVMYDYIPKELMERPKWGFSIPLGSWLKRDLKFLIDQYLSPSAIEQTGIFDPTVVQQIIHHFFNGKDYYYNRIWQLIILQKWLIKNS